MNKQNNSPLFTSKIIYAVVLALVSASGIFLMTNFFKGTPPFYWLFLIVNFIPHLISVIASNNPHGGNNGVFFLVMFIQWFVIWVGLIELGKYRSKCFGDKFVKPSSLTEDK